TDVYLFAGSNVFFYNTGYKRIWIPYIKFHFIGCLFSSTGSRNADLRDTSRRSRLHIHINKLFSGRGERNRTSGGFGAGWPEKIVGGYLEAHIPLARGRREHRNGHTYFFSRRQYTAQSSQEHQRLFHRHGFFLHTIGALIAGDYHNPY